MLTPLQSQVLSLLDDQTASFAKHVAAYAGFDVIPTLRELRDLGLVEAISHGSCWRRTSPPDDRSLTVPARHLAEYADERAAERAEQLEAEREQVQRDLATLLDGWKRADVVELAAVRERSLDRAKPRSSLRSSVVRSMTIGIYEAVHKPTGKSYVGQSRDVEARVGCGTPGGCRNSRWKCHHCSALLGSSLPLHNDMRMLGLDQFEWKVLEQCEAWELDDRELFHIAQRVNAGVPTYNLIGVRRHRDPNLFSGKDVDNPHVADKVRKPRKRSKRLTGPQVEDLVYLRDRGHTTVKIALLFDITPCGVSHAYNRVKRSA